MMIACFVSFAKAMFKNSMEDGYCVQIQVLWDDSIPSLLRTHKVILLLAFADMI